MDQVTQEMLRTAEESVKQLVETCRKTGPLYRERPKHVAQVSRTGKWLLNAITVLKRELDTTPAKEEASKS